MANSNLAYDFELFEEKSKEKSVPELNVVKSRAKGKARDRAFALKLSATAIAMVAVIAVMINSRIELMEVADEVAGLEKEYATLVDENGRLNAQLESETSLRNIEEQARSLGMAKIEEDQIEYLALENNDEIIVAKNTNNALKKIMLTFTGFLEYFGN